MGGGTELVERFIASLEARDWEGWAALLHPDVVYEIPQSRASRLAMKRSTSSVLPPIPATYRTDRPKPGSTRSPIRLGR